MVLVYGEAAGNEIAALRIYQESYPHRVTPSHTLFAKIIQPLRERGIFTVNRLIVVLQGGVTTPTLNRTYCIALRDPSMSTQTILEWVCLIVTSGRFFMSSNYTITISRGYIQWVQPILNPVLISVYGSYTVVWKRPTFHDRYS